MRSITTVLVLVAGALLLHAPHASAAASYQGLVGQASNNANVGSSTIPITANIPARSLVVVVVAEDILGGMGHAHVVSDSANNVYARLGTNFNTTVQGTFYYAYLRTALTTSDVITIPQPAAETSSAIAVQAFQGLSNTPANIGTQGLSPAGSSIIYNITAPAGTYLRLTVHSVEAPSSDPWAVAAPAIYATPVSNSAVSPRTADVAFRVDTSAAGALPVQGTWSGSYLVAGMRMNFRVSDGITPEPTNTVLVSWSGTPVTGNVLGSNLGTWTGAPTYSRQWVRCDASGLACAAIVGATANNYTITATDEGSTLRVQVLGCNVGGCTASLSTATPVIVPPAPTNSTPPWISGAPVLGEVQTANAGTWTGSPTFTYQWKRCDALGGSCTDIIGATASTYTPVVLDLGATLRVDVTGTNAGGSQLATSAQTEPIDAAGSGSVLTVDGSGTTIQSWPRPRANGIAAYCFGGGSAACGAANRRVYVTNRTLGRVYVYQEDGTLLRTWDSPNADAVAAYCFGGSSGACSNANSRVYVTDPVGGRVYVFNDDGTPVNDFASAGALSVAAYCIGSQTVACSNANSRVYVTSTNLVQVYNTDGTFVRSFAASGARGVAAMCLGAWNVACTNVNSRVYVTDPGSSLVRVFNDDGTAVKTFAAVNTGAVASYCRTDADAACSNANTRVVVANNAGNVVNVYDDDGVSISSTTPVDPHMVAAYCVGARNAASCSNANQRVSMTLLAPPTNSILPAITGSAVIGQLLSSDAGTWNGAPHAYAYQWLRCDAAGASCVDIVGETSTTYTLALVDSGSTVRVRVTATNPAGSTSVDSAQTSVVGAGVTVTVATPNSGPQGRRDLVVQVTGTGFVNGADVTFSGAGITVSSTAWVSAVRVDATITIDDGAATTTRDVTVTNPDLSDATSVGAFTVTAPAITLGVSSLGYADVARDATAPHELGWGTLLPGYTREIGPVGSGQALAGPAIQIDVTSDTDYALLASSTTWTDGASETIPIDTLRHKHHLVSEPWTAFQVTDQILETLQTPGTRTHSYDFQVEPPIAAAAASYSTSMTWTVVPSP